MLGAISLESTEKIDLNIHKKFMQIIRCESDTLYGD